MKRSLVFFGSLSLSLAVFAAQARAANNTPASCPQIGGTWKTVECKILQDTASQFPVGFENEIGRRPFTIGQEACSYVTIGGERSRIGMFSSRTESKVARNDSVEPGAYTETSVYIYKGPSLVHTQSTMNVLGDTPNRKNEAFTSVHRNTLTLEPDGRLVMIDQGNTDVEGKALTKLQCVYERVAP
jgi:hypothetical protein